MWPFPTHLVLFLELLRPELQDADVAQPGGDFVDGEDVLAVGQQLAAEVGVQGANAVVGGAAVATGPEEVA